MIGIKSNHHFSIISICNWETYQVDEIKEELQGNYKVTTKELQGNTLKEVKNVRKKEKDKIKHKYGEYKNILLTDEEKEKLKKKFGKDGAIKKIQQMDEGIELKGYKYKSHYLAILKWAKNENRTEDNERKIIYDPDGNELPVL